MKHIPKSHMAQWRRTAFYKTEGCTGEFQDRSLNRVMRVKARRQRFKQVAKGKNQKHAVTAKH